MNGAVAFAPRGTGSIKSMDMQQIWPRLAPSTQTWLIEHNGEPLADDIVDEILTVTWPLAGLSSMTATRPRARLKRDTVPHG
jgi:hypothetical protein